MIEAIPTEFKFKSNDKKMAAFLYAYPLKIVVRDDRGTEAQWKWAVTSGINVVDKELEAEYEPMPSSRTDDFIERTRFSFTEALDVARRFAEKAVNEDFYQPQIRRALKFQEEDKKILARPEDEEHPIGI